MVPLHALKLRMLNTQHPYTLEHWHALLQRHPSLQKHAHLLTSFRFGFQLGIRCIIQTFIPPNSSSTCQFASHFQAILREELRAQRIFGPFTQLQVESLIGHFQTSPLSLIPKHEPNTYRLIQNLSFPPCPQNSIASINSSIDANQFPTFYGTFTTVVLLINSLPPGSEALTRDVQDAYRTIPLHPNQWPGTVLRGEFKDQFYINTANCFGLTSAGGVWGQVADCICDLFRVSGLGPITKWVDDFLIFRLPASRISAYNTYRATQCSLLSLQQLNSRLFYSGPILPDGTLSEFDDCHTFPLQDFPNSSAFAYSESYLDTLSADLGIPWNTAKSTHFSTTVTYLGFLWDLEARTIQLTQSKQHKYLQAIRAWQTNVQHSQTEVQSLYGKLLHISLILPYARAYLAQFEKFLSNFTHNPHIRRRAPKRLTPDLAWWVSILTKPQVLAPIPTFDYYTPIPAFSDASSAFGLGVVYDKQWASFAYHNYFCPSKYDIAWAESIAVLILLLFLQNYLPTYARFAIHCDNQVVTHCFHVGYSHNVLVNEVLKEIFTLCQINHWQIQLLYVPSQQNPADKPSRGMPAAGTPLPYLKLPSSLSTFVYQCKPSTLRNQKPLLFKPSSFTSIPTTSLETFHFLETLHHV